MTALREPPQVVVLGAGPAGLGAALWCATLGLRALVLEARDVVGGQLHEIPVALDNLPGLPGVAPSSFAEALRAQCVAAGVAFRTGAAAALDARSLQVRHGPEGLAVTPEAVVIATGVRRRRLDVPGERALLGRGLRYNIGPRPEDLRGARVVVIGGGDDAFEHLRLLAPLALSLTLVHRGARFTARPALREPALRDERVRVLTDARVEAIEGAERVEAVRVRASHGEERLDADAVFVCVGPEPESAGFGVALDPRGYVRVDRLQRTSRTGVYAVGDVCCPEAPTIPTALGHGATAAKAIVSARSLAWPSESSPDTLTVRGLSFAARIGVYPREWRRRQTLTFDLGFDLDASASAPTDSLRRTVDYAAVADAVEALLGEQHFNLIETVADTLASRLLASFDARAVRVRVTKPGVPQRHSTASIEVERRRP